MAQRSNEIGTELCRALGIDSGLVQAIHIDLVANEPIRMTVDILPDRTQLQPLLRGLYDTGLKITFMSLGDKLAEVHTIADREAAGDKALAKEDA